MHPYLENWVAIGRAVVYCARSVQAFSAGIKCQHCKVFYAVSHSRQVTGIKYHPQSNQINENQIGYAMACFGYIRGQVRGTSTIVANPIYISICSSFCYFVKFQANLLTK